ncbi:MAG: peptidase M64 [bacterium]|nr:MAG: peptidase M64 [bacterium]
MRLLQLLFVIILFACTILSGYSYEDYFTVEALRIDFFEIGDKSGHKIVLDELFRENRWSGNPEQLIDTLNMGHYLLQVFELDKNDLIFSFGYSTLFKEWQTTDEAITGNHKVLRSTLHIPFPQQKILLKFLTRDRENHFTDTLGSFVIDPALVAINHENSAMGAEVIELEINGPSTHKVDLLFVAEGYTALEREKFEQDLIRMRDILFRIEPFKSEQQSFNIRGIFYPSRESGIDEPTKDIFKNTALNFTFNMFGSHRYLMVYDPKRLHDISTAAPRDALIVLINSAVYGGGGIYNCYATVAVDNGYASNILVHELGHSFGGLGDEYYTTDIAYNEFYPTDVEPWEPNLTIQTNLETLKWAHHVTAGIEIPTAWNKFEYDEMNTKYYEKVGELGSSNASTEKREKLRKDYTEKTRLFFEQHALIGKIGAFEGGGYNFTGMYRPSLECLMFSNRQLNFDGVCLEALQKRIKFLSQ